MTTQVKLQTNGNYVAEVKDSGGNIRGSAGPGTMVESGWIGIDHSGTNTITERPATDEEVAAAAEAAKAKDE